MEADTTYEELITAQTGHTTEQRAVALDAAARIVASAPDGSMTMGVATESGIRATAVLEIADRFAHWLATGEDDD